MWIMWQLDHAVPCLVRIVAGNETKAFEPQSFDIRCGYGSIPIDTFLVGWTSIYQLFWGSLGTRVLTHPHVSIWLNLSTCRHPCSSLHIFWHLVRCADHWEAAILVSRNLVIAFSMTLDIWYIYNILYIYIIYIYVIYIYSIYYIYIIYIYVIYIYIIYIYIYLMISGDSDQEIQSEKGWFRVAADHTFAEAWQSQHGKAPFRSWCSWLVSSKWLEHLELENGMVSHGFTFLTI